MMKSQLLYLALLPICLSSIASSSPIQDENRNYNSEYDTTIDDRTNHRRRPCRGKESNGRTFFDWQVSYVNVNHNFICGGGGGGGNGGGIHGGGGGIHGGGGGIHGGGGILGGGGGILGGGGHGSGGGGQGGLANRPILNSLVGSISSSLGSSISSLPSLVSANNIPYIGGFIGSAAQSLGNSVAAFPANIGGNDHSNNNNNNNDNGGGLFGLGLLNWFGHLNRPSAMHETEKPQEPEKPVHEDYDDVAESYQNAKPGQHITASNPIFGTYSQDITNFNPNRIIKQVNREVNKLFRPLYHLLRRR